MVRPCVELSRFPGFIFALVAVDKSSRRGYRPSSCRLCGPALRRGRGALPNYAEEVRQYSKYGKLLEVFRARVSEDPVFHYVVSCRGGDPCRKTLIR